LLHRLRQLAARPQLPAAILAGAALFPWLYGLGNEFLLGDLREAMSGDLSVLALGILDAQQGERFIGPYSRFGWNHPGPIYFYTLLPLYALLGSPAAALYVGATLIGLFALLGLIHISWTSFRDGDRSWLALTPILLLAHLPAIVGAEVRPWNPAVVVLPFALLLLTAARLANGHTSALPWAVGLHAFVTQTHVTTALAASSVLAGAVFFAARNPVSPSARRSRRTDVAIAAAVACGVWFPVLWDQLRGERNLGAIVRFAIDSDGVIGLATGLRLVSRQLAAFFTVPLGLRDTTWGTVVELASGGCLCVLLPLSARRARALGDQLTYRVVVLISTALIAALVSAARTVGEPHDYIVNWILALGAMAWAATLRPWMPARSPAILAPIVAVAFAAGSLVRALPWVHLAPSTLTPLAEVQKATTAGLLEDVASVRSWNCSPLLMSNWKAPDDDWGLLAMLVLELSRRGEPVTLHPRHRFMFGPRFDYQRHGDCVLMISSVRDRTMPLLSRHDAAFAQIIPPDQKLPADADQRFQLLDAGGAIRPERAVDGSVPPPDTPFDDDRILLLPPNRRLRLQAPPIGWLQGLTLVGNVAATYRVFGSADGQRFHPIGEIASTGLPDLDRRWFHFDEPVTVLEIEPIPGTEPHAVAEVTPLLGEGLDLAVGTEGARAFLREGWSKNAEDDHSAFAWLRHGHAALELQVSAPGNHWLMLWAASVDQPGSEPSLRVSVNGSSVGIKAVIAGEQTVRVELPAALLGPRIRLDLDLLPRPGVNDGAGRELAIAVRRIVLTPVQRESKDPL
jgi:hypothetical protein